MQWDARRRECVPRQPACPPGMHWDERRGECF
jgi:hypothetical protein